MVAKITVTGKRVSPIVTLKDFHRFEMQEGGSPSAPKGLPLASSVLYSVFVGLKQGRAINILNLPEDQLFSIAGEVNMSLPKKICPGQIGVIAFNTKLIDLNDKKPKTVGELSNSPVIEDPIVQEVKGIINIESNNANEKSHMTCTFCSIKMDKRLAHFKPIDPNKPSTDENMSIVCPDCLNDRPNPSLGELSIAPKAIRKFESLGMDEPSMVKFLSGFIGKFVLINISDSINLREYWVPLKQPIFKFKVVDTIITDLQIIKDRL